MGRKTTSTLLARRYAKALFVTAKEGKSVPAVKKDVTAFAEILGDGEVLHMLSNPVIATNALRKVADDLAQKNEFSDIFAGFLKIIAQNRRFGLYPLIAEAFTTVVADDKGEAEAELIVASRVKKEQVKPLEEALSSALDKKVKVKQRTDKSILGGAVVRVGSWMIDASLSGKLSRISRTLRDVN